MSDDFLTKEQFNEFKDRFDRFESELKADIKQIFDKLSELNVSVSKIKTDSEKACEEIEEHKNKHGAFIAVALSILALEGVFLGIVTKLLK